MKAKPGDLAIITKGRERNIGKLIVVTSFYGNVDYSNMGYGILPCWNVESLGANDLDAGSHLGSRGYIPDMALAPIAGMDANETEALRKAKAKQDFDDAMKELGEVFRSMEANKKAEKTALKAIRKAAKTKRRTVHG